MEAPDFWDDAEVSQKKMKELKDMKDDMETYQNLVTQMEDMETMIEMGYEENDPALIPEIQEMLDEFQKDFDNIRIKTLLSGEYDSENAIIKLNAGAGGTEACDWCGMLYRMYSRWADKKGFTLEVLDYLDGDEAGIKSVTFQVNGTNAYGYLKSEKGVHRLVRISLQTAIRAELISRGIYKPVATILTQVVIDPYDDAFAEPEKIIGRVLTEEEAETEESKGNFVTKLADGTYKRILAAPKPQKIVELETIRTLVDAGQVVIAAGGGGIPVMEQGIDLHGASAIIEKDLSSGLLAQELNADTLLILTSVEKVSLNLGQDNEEYLNTI